MQDTSPTVGPHGAALGLCLIALLVYLPTLHHELVWDDLGVITHNRSLRSLPAALRTFVAAPDAAGNEPHDPSTEITRENYRPLRTLVHALVYSAWGAEPAPYHALNVLLHAAVCLSLFRLLCLLSPGNTLGCFLGAALFAVHPLNTEVVCWAKQAEDMLAALFVLWTVMVWLRLPAERVDVPRMAAGALLFVGALLSKESAIFLPAWLLAWLWLERGAGPTFDGTRLWRGALARCRGRAWAAFTMGVLVVVFLVWRHLVLGQTAQAGFVTGDCWTTWLSMPRVLLRYLRLEAVPVGLLADYHGFPRAGSMADTAAWGYAIGLVAVTAALTWLAWRRRLLAGWIWFWLALLPVLNLVPMLQLGAERFLYLPTMGIGMILAQSEVAQTRPRAAVAALLPVLCVFAALTVLRSREWRNELSLWEATVCQVPWDDRARRNLAKALLTRGRAGDALPVLQGLHADSPSTEHAMLLGYAFCCVGRVDEGVHLLRAAGAGLVLNDLGAEAALNREWGQAERYFKLALEVEPDSARYRYNLELLRCQMQAAGTAPPGPQPPSAP